MRLNAFDNEQAVAQILLEENVKSVNYRYSESETTQIEYDRGAPILTAIQAIKAAQCLRYQSCEHPAFEDSLASKFIEAIIADAIPRLEGYDSAAWAIYDKVTAWEALQTGLSPDHLTREFVISTICNLRTRNERNEDFIIGQRKTQSKYCMSFICQIMQNAQRLNNLRWDYEPD